jgi:hypothetical protein
MTLVRLLGTQRSFCFSGPPDCEREYALPSFAREGFQLKGLMELIDNKKWFLVHAQRQSGKTSFCLDLRDYLNSLPGTAALYVNVEGAQTARDDVETGMKAIVTTLDERVRTTFGLNLGLADLTTDAGGHMRLAVALSALARSLSSDRVIVIIDEIDALLGDLLLAVLRQLRSQYDLRGKGQFPVSIVLVGVRNIKDYQIYSAKEKKYVAGGSPFNVSAGNLTPSRFSRKHVVALLMQHTTATRQAFSDSAIDALMVWSDGQPWIVNRLAALCVGLTTGPVGSDNVYTAAHRVIALKDTHLDNFLSVLAEPRVLAVVQTVLCGDDMKCPEADVDYVREMGLLNSNAGGKLQISTKLYEEILPRAVVQVHGWLQTKLDNSIEPPHAFLASDESIDMAKVFESFQRFCDNNLEEWRNGSAASAAQRPFCSSCKKNVRHREEHPHYEQQQLDLDVRQQADQADLSDHRSGRHLREAHPHVLFFSHLQRVVNGGGRVQRETAAGRGFVDIVVEKVRAGGSWARPETQQRAAIEVKRYDQGDMDQMVSAAVEQVIAYGLRAHATEHHVLVFFQQQQQDPWTQSYHSVVTGENGTAVQVWFV